MYRALGVGISGKSVACRYKLAAQLKIIFNNSVVNQNKVFRDLRVRVHLAWHSVGRPAGVTYPAAAFNAAARLDFAAQLCYSAGTFDRHYALLSGH